MRRGGENISGFEMERSFIAHPEIEEVAVHAVFSELSEDEVKVTAVLREGSTLTEEDLCRWAIDRVPYYAVPRFIEFRTSLPRSPVGRILKYQLRDDGVTPQTWDRVKANLTFAKR
ncbi:Long-chain-fatty-acid--CoA ligase [compost metagenome]